MFNLPKQVINGLDGRIGIRDQHPVGTGLQTLPRPQALTLAFTTFMLFQLFNAFNARAGNASVCTPHLFTNGKLWLTLAGVLGLQVLAVHWPPAQGVFHTAALAPAYWLAAFTVAASILVLNEGRKLVIRLWRPRRGAF